MTTKQERLCEHARKLGQIGGDSFSDIWKAQARYLDQHFVERTAWEQLLAVVKLAKDSRLSKFYFAQDWTDFDAAIDAALEASKEE